MNRLSIEQRTQIISALVEGNAINATPRMTGISDHVWSIKDIVELVGY
jgi:hypothetical protein